MTQPSHTYITAVDVGLWINTPAPCLPAHSRSSMRNLPRLQCVSESRMTQIGTACPIAETSRPDPTPQRGLAWSFTVNTDIPAIGGVARL